jgi:hypothetical protein
MILRSEEMGVAYFTLDSKKYYEEIESEKRKKMPTAIGHWEGLIRNDSISEMIALLILELVTAYLWNY